MLKEVIAMNAIIRKEERSKINHSNFHFMNYENKKKLNPKQAEEKK